MENGIILRKLLQPQWHNLSPLEIKLFLNLFLFSFPDDYNLQLSLNALSKKVFLQIREIKRTLQKLQNKNLIIYKLAPQTNSASHFKIIISHALTAEPVAPAKLFLALQWFWGWLKLPI